MYCMYVCVCRRNSFKHCLCLPPCRQTPRVPTTGGSPCEYSGSDTVHSDSVKLIAAVSNFGLCSLHRMKMVAKLGSLTQRVQTLSSASTLVYSQLSLLQLSRAAASGRYTYMYTYTCTVHITNSVAGSTHACMRTQMQTELLATWSPVYCLAHGTADHAAPSSCMLGRGIKCSSNLCNAVVVVQYVVQCQYR